MDKMIQELKNLGYVVYRRPRSKKYDPIRKDSLARSVRKRVPVKHIARVFGCSEWHVRQEMKRHGIKHHRPWREYSNIATMRLDHRFSDEKIAKALGCSPGTANRWRHIHGEHESLCSGKWSNWS